MGSFLGDFVGVWNSFSLDCLSFSLISFSNLTLGLTVLTSTLLFNFLSAKDLAEVEETLLSDNLSCLISMSSRLCLILSEICIFWTRLMRSCRSELLCSIIKR